MRNQILLYISAAADLMVERDVLSRAVTEIPLDIGWRIIQSPLKESDGPLVIELVAAADIHLLLLGGDIRAPIGQEWLLARRAGRMPLTCLKQGVNRTAAAEDFRRFVGLQTDWRRFESLNRLQEMVLDHLADYLVQQAGRIEMTPAEYDRLMAWREERAEAASAAEDGAAISGRPALGQSSIILTQDRLRPNDGTLIEPLT